jgi:DNA repair protein RadC
MDYNKHDRKEYKFYVFNIDTKKILSGWEYKLDANSHKNELSFPNLKLYTRTYLVRINCDPKSNRNWGADLGAIKYNPEPEVVLYGDFRKEVQIPEIKVRYNKGKAFDKIQSSEDVHRFLKRVYGRNIGLQEHFVLLLTDNQLNITGYYKHTVGTPTSTLADIPMLMGIILKSLARSFIISHNHPSGNTQPSEADKRLTKQVMKASKAIGVNMLDHIIVTAKNGYYSFGDEGSLNGLGDVKAAKGNTELRLREEIFSQLNRVNKDDELTPKIYELIQTKNGYKWVETSIIQMMISDGITASACVPQIESEL